MVSLNLTWLFKCQRQTYQAAYFRWEKTLGKRTILSLREPWNIRNSQVYARRWLRRLCYQNFQVMWHPSGSGKYWSLPPFKIESQGKEGVTIKLSKKKDMFNILQRKKKLLILQNICWYYKSSFTSGIFGFYKSKSML